MKKAYLVELSSKTRIRIDEDEVPKIIKAIQTGQPAIVRQGLFNPSFYVCLIVDPERTRDLQEKITDIEKHNNHDALYNQSKDQKPMTDLPKLKNVFAGIELLNEKMNVKSLK